MDSTIQKPQRLVNLYLENNPNPNSLKFVANFMLVGEGENYDFPDETSAEHAPLAKELFKYAFVKRVFYMNNFVTITKDENVEWSDIQGQLKTHIQQYLEAEKPVLVKADPLLNEILESDPDVVKNIKSVLEEYIKPAVESDGGAIVFQDFEDGVVKVALQGACSGCPSSMVTLKAGIENLLKRMVPEVHSVEAVSL